MDFITQPLFILLTWLYEFTGNFGLAIIAMTFLIRGVLLPLTLPALRAQKKMRSLKPELDKLKSKYKDDKSALGQAQLELYKEYDVNPLSGCLPYLVQFGVLIALYQVLRRFIGDGASGLIENITFLGVNLTEKDGTYVLPILAAALQFVLSLMILPGAESRDIIPDDSNSKIDKEMNEKEDDLQDMGAMMQKQMMFVMPVMTGIMAASFPAGLAVYWIATTLFSIVQQLFISGPGGLVKYTPSFFWKYFQKPTVTGGVKPHIEKDFAAAMKKSSHQKKNPKNNKNTDKSSKSKPKKKKKRSKSKSHPKSKKKQK